MIFPSRDSTYKVTILALEGASATSITGPLDVFSLPAGQQDCHTFAVEVASPQGKTTRCGNGYCITPDCAMDEVNHPGLIVIPSLPPQASNREHAPVLAWLREQYVRGTQIAALCAGTFMLAATGLLDGKEATTQWGQKEQFRQLYPKVLLQPEQSLTDTCGLYCAGAMHACLDLPLYLVGKLTGPDMRESCAKVMGYGTSCILAPPQLASPPSYLAYQNADMPIKKAQRILELNFAQDMSTEKLAMEAGMGRRTFERHFKTITGYTPLTYLHRVRIEMAKNLLATSDNSFEEITARVGYEDSKFFRKIFVRQTGYLPTAYRRSGKGT